MHSGSWIFKDRYEFRVVETFAGDPDHTRLVQETLGGPPPLGRLLNESEFAAHERLRGAFSEAVRYRLGVYLQNRLVGFTLAFHSDGSNLHMGMSVVEASHRRQGIYSELVRAVLAFAREQGFQSVDSHHRNSNNPVIIAKLRLGFIITGLKVCDLMGCLVQLTYPISSLRRQLLEVRSGMRRPESQLRELFF